MDNDAIRHRDEESDFSIQDLEDRIASLAHKMEKHSVQQQEAFELVVENGKSIDE